jgi:hypothetical protein
MGKIVTPAYRIEYRDNLLAMRKTASDGRSRIDGLPVLIASWRGKDYGRATVANIEAWRQGMNKSFATGGTNEHLTKAYGIIPHIYFARIVRQSDDKVIAETKAPMFEVA